VVFLAAKYDTKGRCIGLDPAYLGTVDKGEGHIDFLFRLQVISRNGDIYLMPGAKIDRLKKIMKKGEFDTRLVFLAQQLRMNAAMRTQPWWYGMDIGRIGVSKIIEYDKNKIGGVQPVIFPIHEIMPDEKSLQFVRYEKTKP